MSCEYWDEEIKTCRRSDVPKITLPEHIILDDLVSDEFKVVRAIDLPEPKIENRWIPVTERLPEKTSKYLVTVGINFFGFGMNDEVSVAIYNIKDGWFCAEENKDTIIGDVTAWMPLPEPWKGDEE